MPERKRVPVHKPYKLGWEEGEVYCFQIKGNVHKHMTGYEEYIGWYALFYVDKVFTDDWYVRGVQDEMADLFFFLQKERPRSAEDISSAKKVLFNRGYKAYLCEISKKERPKDLICLGKCHTFEYPSERMYLKSHFSWDGYTYERDILKGYAKELKRIAENK